MSIDLDELKRKFDALFTHETESSFNEWLTKTQTDNSNIVVESLEDKISEEIKRICKDADNFTYDNYGSEAADNGIFEVNYSERSAIQTLQSFSNWQKEQYKPILESHKKLVESFSHILQWTKTKDGKGEFKTSKEQIEEFKMQLFESMEIKNKLNIQ